MSVSTAIVAINAFDTAFAIIRSAQKIGPVQTGDEIPDAPGAPIHSRQSALEVDRHSFC